MLAIHRFEEQIQSELKADCLRRAEWHQALARLQFGHLIRSQVLTGAESGFESLGVMAASKALSARAPSQRVYCFYFGLYLAQRWVYGFSLNSLVLFAAELKAGNSPGVLLLLPLPVRAHAFRAQ